MDEVGAVRTAQRGQEQVLGCEAGVRRVEMLRTEAAAAAVARVAVVAGVAARRDRARRENMAGVFDSRMGASVGGKGCRVGDWLAPRGDELRLRRKRLTLALAVCRCQAVCKESHVTESAYRGQTRPLLAPSPSPAS